MDVDLKNSLTFSAVFGPKAQANNTGGGGLNLRGYLGKVAVVVTIGTKTIGDNDGTISVLLQTSATNNISNAVNYGTSTVNTSNNASATGVINVDTRDALQYLFAVPTVAGTNSPSYPLAVVAVGKLQVQPAQ